jgi:hypothetical protein
MRRGPCSLQTGDLKLYWVPGSHVGFEDTVKVEFDGFILQRLLFFVIDILLYRLEVGAVLLEYQGIK